MSKLRVMELFSGYGSQRMALRNLGIDFESVGISEIDIPAILSYASIHDGLQIDDENFEYPSKEEMLSFLESKNIGLDFKTKKVKLPKNLNKLKQIYRAVIISNCFGDISLLKGDELPNMDLLTYSFPCQDLSSAGQQRGLKRGQTRSGLLYECEKIIEVKRPKYLLLENVKNLVSKKFKPQFDEWLTYLESLGYTNYWKVLNAKDFGLAQNRQRVFVVSIWCEHPMYEFPKGQTYIPQLKEFLESSVDESFYLSPKVQTRFQPKSIGNGIVQVVETATPPSRTIGQHDLVYGDEGVMGRLAACDFKNPTKIILPSITTKVPLECLQEVAMAVLTLAETTRKEKCGLTIHPNLNLRPHRLDAKKSGLSELNVSYEENLSHTITTTHSPKIYGESTDYRIRKITPRECFRLMGLKESDIDKIQATGLSNAQQYKLAGNSIVVNVLEGIFKELFIKN